MDRIASDICEGCGSSGAIYDGLCPRCDACPPWVDCDEYCDDDDCCVHGVGFDEDCDHCDWEMDVEDAEARRQARLAADPQWDMFEQPTQDSATEQRTEKP